MPVLKKKTNFKPRSNSSSAVKKPPRVPKPPKDSDDLEMDGEVIEHILWNDYFISIEWIWKVKAYTSGKMKFNKISITVWDKVKVKINPNDWTQGIITFRYR